MEQQTSEWFAARAGKATASRIADILATTKTGPSTSRTNYAAQLVAERLTGTVEEGYSNAAMQWGVEKEAEARLAYAFLHGVAVDQTGFIQHPRIVMAGASPDGLIGDEGLVEIKCPNTATHIATLFDATVPKKYLAQMQWQMACTGRQWCDFASYDPRLPDSMRLYVQRVARDDAWIADTEAAVDLFLREVEATVTRLRARYEPNPPATFLDAG